MVLLVIMKEKNGMFLKILGSNFFSHVNVFGHFRKVRSLYQTESVSRYFPKSNLTTNSVANKENPDYNIP